MGVFEKLLDPAGIPSPAIIFQILMVLTFTLHILFVNLTIGSITLSIYGSFKNDENWKKLSKSLAKVTPVSIAFTILMGIAPLLFVQVIYDPLWYTSSVLSAWWVVAFIVAMMIAYSFSYVYYLKGDKYVVFAIVALVLFVFSGFVVHVINYQGLFPEKWVEWYTRGGINSHGTGIYAFSLPRFLHFMVPSLAVVGVFLMFYSWYFRGREDFDSKYLAWVGGVGASLAFYVTVLQAVVGIFWVVTVPGRFRFYMHPAFLLSVLFALILLYLLYDARKNPGKVFPAGVMLFITVFAMAYSREFLRMKYLAEAGYSIFSRKVTPDWGSFVLFGATFLMGVIIATFLYSLVFKAGRKAGVYKETEGDHKYAKISIALMIAWIVVVVSLGIFILVKYTFA